MAALRKENQSRLRILNDCLLLLPPLRELSLDTPGTLQDDLDNPSLLPSVVDGGALEVAFVLAGGRQEDEGPRGQQPGRRRTAVLALRGKHIDINIANAS